MTRHAGLLLFFCLATFASAGEPARPDQDDADLHDVCFRGANGWAVGDRGVVWKSTDNGESWRFVATGTEAPLRSVWFLDERQGWAAGGEIGPYALRPTGVLLQTTDGGETWRPAEIRTHQPAGARNTPKPSTFPRLHFVRFFSATQGLVAGDPDDLNPSGVLVTADGGASWHAMPGTAVGNWRSGDFVSSIQGALVGPRGALSLASDGQLVPARNAVVGLPAFGGIALSKTGTSWLVGDGGTVLQSVNGGVSWQDPPRPLPDAARQLFDFRTVAARGAKVWIAGHPGSAVWHSPDHGRSWFRQRTGHPLPLTRLAMQSDTEGCAVGTLGTILRTSDGGRSWAAVRAGDRRLALWSLLGQEQSIAWDLQTALAGEEGYRSRVHVLVRRDIGPDGIPGADRDQRLSEAALAAGASGVSIDWQFPLNTPGLDLDYEKLLADWNQRAEGKLREMLLQQIVRDVRTWRPSMLVIDRPRERDAVSQLIGELIPVAVEQAADPTRFVDHLQVAGLEPWLVSRVCERLPHGEAGPIALDPWRFLPRKGQALSVATESARSRLETAGSTDAFALANVTARDSFQATDDPVARDLFAGLVLAPGTEARRSLAALDERTLISGQKRAERQRNFAAYSEKFLSDPRIAGQLVAQIGDITRDMPDVEAAQQMARLAERHLAEGQWDLAELQLVELCNLYPDQPVAQLAMLRLMQFWGGAETSWRRIRQSQVDHRQARFNPDAAVSAVEQAVAKLRLQGSEDVPFAIESPKPEGIQPASFETPGATERLFVKSMFQYWRVQSVRMSRELEARGSTLMQTAGAQFSLAAAHRHRGDGGKASEIHRKFFQDSNHPWWLAASGELWLLQPQAITERPTGVCRYTEERPVLDGILADGCWQAATELPLTAIPGAPPGPDHAFAMLAYDAKYLYVAVRAPRAEGVRTDPPKTAGRQRDEDLEEFDRVTLLLDTDRDYATHFRLTIDQRGCTAEDCWSDRSWNPQWYVAADADDRHWRVETAIPLDELVPELPSSATFWNVNFLRTIPAVGFQTWSHPASAVPRLENSGMVRFER